MYEHGLTYNKDYDKELHAKLLELDGVIINRYSYQVLEQTFISMKYVMSLENTILFIKYYRNLIDNIN